MIYKCLDGCCTIDIVSYSGVNKSKFTEKKKAGVFLYDPDNDRVLIVQNKGNLWGIPKGTFEDGEDSLDCAIREVEEETGIILERDKLEKCRNYVIDNRVTYYLFNMTYNKIKNPNNDVNGISWVKIECLKKLVKNGNIKLNYHAKIIFKRIMNINFL